MISITSNDHNVNTYVPNNKQRTSKLQFQAGRDDKHARLNVAIGCAITSHGEHLTTENIAQKLPLLKSLTPSFCNTASNGFNYYFYVSYDVSDPCFNKKEYISSIHKTFRDLVQEYCPVNSNVSLYFVRCNHNNNPAWAQNDAMMEAYLDHMDYYYRLYKVSCQTLF